MPLPSTAFQVQLFVLDTPLFWKSKSLLFVMWNKPEEKVKQFLISDNTPPPSSLFKLSYTRTNNKNVLSQGPAGTGQNGVKPIPTAGCCCSLSQTEASVFSPGPQLYIAGCSELKATSEQTLASIAIHIFFVLQKSIFILFKCNMVPTLTVYIRWHLIWYYTVQYGTVCTMCNCSLFFI